MKLKPRTVADMVSDPADKAKSEARFKRMTAAYQVWRVYVLGSRFYDLGSGISHPRHPQGRLQCFGTLKRQGPHRNFSALLRNNPVKHSVTAPKALLAGDDWLKPENRAEIPDSVGPPKTTGV